MELSLDVRSLMDEMSRLAKSQGFENARVQAKLNARGELVIAVLIPPRCPREWGTPPDRELKRLARERR